MSIRRVITASLVTATIAFGGTAMALVGVAQATSSCGTSHSSSSQTYGGQGSQIGQLACKAKTTSASALPFTGLDVGLLVAAGAVLLCAGLVLRWRLRQHGAQ